MSHITTCPCCHADIGTSPHITERGLICPHCQHPLRSGLPDLDSPNLDTDVRRGISPITIVLGVLIALNVTAIAGVWLTHTDIGLAILLGLLFIPLDILVLTLILYQAVSRSMHAKETPPMGWWPARAFVVACAMVGVLIVFFFTCHGLMALKGVGL